MEVSTMFSRMNRRLAPLAVVSWVVVSWTSDNAFGQQYRLGASNLSPPAGFSLQDIPLAEGERIISSTIDGKPIELEDSVPLSAGPTGLPEHADHDAFPMNPGYAAGGSMRSVLSGCATGRCGGCRGCGQSGRMNAGVLSAVDLGGRPRLGIGGDVCGPTCNPYRYASADVLYMKNNNVSNANLPGFFGISDFDYELGMRVTLGSVPNCRDGFEFTFVGPLEWNTRAVRTDPNGEIFSALLPGDPFLLPSELTSFFGADAQAQSLEAEFWSIEANRTMIGWDVVKLLHGFRYISYDEDFLFLSDRPLADGVLPGVLRSSTKNRMLGFQVGIDMTFPITCRLWSDTRARAGGYANFAENTFQFVNDGELRIFNKDDRARLAGALELGGGLRYYLTNNLFIRGGCELWYMTELAGALQQFSMVMTPSTGNRTQAKDDLFMFGVNLGAEWRF